MFRSQQIDLHVQNAQCAEKCKLHFDLPFSQLQVATTHFSFVGNRTQTPLVSVPFFLSHSSNVVDCSIFSDVMQTGVCFAPKNKYRIIIVHSSVFVYFEFKYEQK